MVSGTCHVKSIDVVPHRMRSLFQTWRSRLLTTHEPPVLGDVSFLKFAKLERLSEQIIHSTCLQHSWRADACHSSYH